MTFLNKLNKLPTCASASSLCRRSVSMAVRYNLRRTWDATPWIKKPQPVQPSIQSLLQLLPQIKGNRVLWIDLVMYEFGLGEVAPYPPDPNADTVEYSYNLNETILYSLDPDFGNRLQGTTKMAKKLREFTKADNQKPPSERIDSVLCYVDHSGDPSQKIWQALDGLTPKHLEIVSEEAELCHVKSLNALRRQWNELETLSLTCIGHYNFMAGAPKIFSRLSSISLHYCSGRNFIPRGAFRLKHLHVEENNACDTFLFGAKYNPTFTQMLEVLELKSNVGCDFVQENEPDDFREALRKCTNLREFRFAASFHDGLDTNLVSYIPPSVEKLVLRFSCSLPFLQDMNDWISHASDLTWLPHLKSFQLTVDPRVETDTSQELSTEEFDREFEKKKTVLYDILKSSRPQVELPM